MSPYVAERQHACIYLNYCECICQGIRIEGGRKIGIRGGWIGTWGSGIENENAMSEHLM